MLFYVLIELLHLFCLDLTCILVFRVLDSLLDLFVVGTLVKRSVGFGP